MRRDVGTTSPKEVRRQIAQDRQRRRLAVARQHLADVDRFVLQQDVDLLVERWLLARS